MTIQTLNRELGSGEKFNLNSKQSFARTAHTHAATARADVIDDLAQIDGAIRRLKSDGHRAALFNLLLGHLKDISNEPLHDAPSVGGSA